ncbi:hypothetical protein [Limosilactobacillus mucosae]|uniref:hypothetical protein n=1 Tax=Limosilactobacillus mucosae TaxID=97478 RepID=UPI000944E348|nr:hypothetical protein [Limosilactobacillus mucosae]
MTEISSIKRTDPVFSYIPEHDFGATMDISIIMLAHLAMMTVGSLAESNLTIVCHEVKALT